MYPLLLFNALNSIGNIWVGNRSNIVQLPQPLAHLLPRDLRFSSVARPVNRSRSSMKACSTASLIVANSPRYKTACDVLHQRCIMHRISGPSALRGRAFLLVRPNRTAGTGPVAPSTATDAGERCPGPPCSIAESGRVSPLASNNPSNSPDSKKAKSLGGDASEPICRLIDIGFGRCAKSSRAILRPRSRR